MFIAALLLTARIWKQTVCQHMNGYRSLSLSLSLSLSHTYTHTEEYYLPMRRKEIISFVTTWMEFEDIRLSDMSDRKRQRLCDVICT